MTHSPIFVPTFEILLGDDRSQQPEREEVGQDEGVRPLRLTLVLEAIEVAFLRLLGVVGLKDIRDGGFDEFLKSQHRVSGAGRGREQVAHGYRSVSGVRKTRDLAED